MYFIIIYHTRSQFIVNRYKYNEGQVEISWS